MAQLWNDRQKTNIKIDIGCGNHKREGFIGIDIAPGEQVDYVLDVERDKLPFEDNSVTHVFSNHTFEHIHAPQNILREIVRVCEQDALVEIWTPYLKSNDAFLLGHFSFYNEKIWMHICCEYDDFYFADAPGRFELQKFHYILYPGILDRLKKMNIPFLFALEHMFNISPEFGAFIRVDKTRRVAKRPQIPKIYISYSRAETPWEVSHAGADGRFTYLWSPSTAWWQLPGRAWAIARRQGLRALAKKASAFLKKR